MVRFSLKKFRGETNHSLSTIVLSTDLKVNFPLRTSASLMVEWGSGVMGSKSQAKSNAREKLLAK